MYLFKHFYLIGCFSRITRCALIRATLAKGQTPDFSVAPKLLEKIPYKISSVYADAAYDRSVVRDACARLKAGQVIQPQRGAIIRKPKKYEHPNTWHDRNAAVKLINRYQDEEIGFAKWKEKIEHEWVVRSEFHYHYDSLTMEFKQSRVSNF